MTSPEAVSPQMLRIVDANLNRIGEGLRFLENLVRFMLDDATLSEQLKTMRHSLITGDLSFNQQLLQSRDAESDVGINIETPEQAKPRELLLMVVANSRRVQEALRTLEELAKLPDMNNILDSGKFMQARFSIYTIEQMLLSKLVRKDKAKGISGLYLIIDTQALKGRSHIEVASEAIRGGARIIQLRDKLRSKKEILPTARQLKNLCAEHNVLFLMNDYLDLALASDADGLHLGQNDLPVKVARKLLPIDKILGCSTTNVDLATTAVSEGVDYVAVGAIYPTFSKTSTTTPAKVVGLETLRQIRQAVSLPLVAIGGITKDNAADVVAAGADSVAVISAVLQAESPEEAARQIATRFDTQK